MRTKEEALELFKHKSSIRISIRIAWRVTGWLRLFLNEQCLSSGT